MAKRWQCRLAQDHAEACFALGGAYAASVDDGIRLDLQEALKYFRKAARAGHAAARRRAAFLDDVFREAAAEGPEAPIFDDNDIYYLANKCIV